MSFAVSYSRRRRVRRSFAEHTLHPSRSNARFGGTTNILRNYCPGLLPNSPTGLSTRLAAVLQKQVQRIKTLPLINREGLRPNVLAKQPTYCSRGVSSWLTPHNPCQQQEKHDHRSETDPRSRQCHRDGTPREENGNEIGKAKRKKGEKRERGERKTRKAKVELTETKRVARSNLKKENHQTVFRPRKTTKKVRQNEIENQSESSKGKFEENQSRQMIDDRLNEDNSRMKLKEVKSNPMDHDQQTPYETLTTACYPC